MACAIGVKEGTTVSFEAGRLKHRITTRLTRTSNFASSTLIACRSQKLSWYHIILIHPALLLHRSPLNPLSYSFFDWQMDRAL